MTRPIRISVNALGGQGGGVLADWIVSLGEAQGWIAQATSVPGVAQRTGATVYYLELAPRDAGGRAPIQALMPVPGDVDIVIAAEMMEAGRAISRGLVSPDRTTMIASSHRVFAIAEKSAMGNGIISPAQVLEACRSAARHLVLADFQAIAERSGSVISATLFGALAGSGALPFPRSAFEQAIERSGVGVASSLRAFAEAFAVAAVPSPMRPIDASKLQPEPSFGTLSQLRTAVGQTLPEPVRSVALLGVERLADYQDAAYASAYLHLLQQVAEAERQLGPGAEDWPLTRECARHLALWMAYEDVIRVADLKTRSARLNRVLTETRATDDQIVEVTEFMHPRFEELCDVLPRKVGAKLIESERSRRWLAPFLERDRKVTTSRLGGFLLLFALAGFRRFRRGTYRYALEQERIGAWLASALNAARTNADVALEIIRCQRLVKGYGDTHARGLHNFATIMRLLPALANRPDAAIVIRSLREAALKDDEGRALQGAISALAGQPSQPVLRDRIRQDAVPA